jgi:hypothetical protein
MALVIALTLGAVTAAPANSHAHHPPPATVDGRVQLMSRELDLDPNQQATLRSLLLAQRAEVSKVWSDPAVPAAVRVAATRAVSEKTAERIRGMLNDEQRAKYSKAQQHDAAVGAPGADVQKWMKSELR